MYEVRNAKFSTYNPPKTSVRRRISRRSQSFQLKVSSHPRYGCIFTLPIHFQNLQTCNMVRWAHVSDTLTILTAKQGDNALGSISVCVCVFLLVSLSEFSHYQKGTIDGHHYLVPLSINELHYPLIIH